MVYKDLNRILIWCPVAQGYLTLSAVDVWLETPQLTNKSQEGPPNSFSFLESRILT